MRQMKTHKDPAITLFNLPERLKAIHPADIKQGAHILGWFAAGQQTERWEAVSEEAFTINAVRGSVAFSELLLDYGNLLHKVQTYLADEGSSQASAAISELQRIMLNLGLQQQIAPESPSVVRKFWKIASASMLAAVVFAVILFMVDGRAHHMLGTAVLLVMFGGAIWYAANHATAPEHSNQRA
jgi:hypothetical protein